MQNTNLVIFLTVVGIFLNLFFYWISSKHLFFVIQSAVRVLTESCLREKHGCEKHTLNLTTPDHPSNCVFLENGSCSISIWKRSQRLSHLALVIYPLTSPEVLPVRCLFMRWQQTHKGKLSAGLPEQQKLQATSLSHPSLPSQPHTITYNCKRPSENVFLPSQLTMICGKTSVLQLTSAPAS